MSCALITCKLFVVIRNRFVRRIIEELVHVIDNVCANENETPEVAAVDTANCYRWTVHFVVRQVLYTFI